jgi:hypothetical protein
VKTKHTLLTVSNVHALQARSASHAKQQSSTLRASGFTVWLRNPDTDCGCERWWWWQSRWRWRWRWRCQWCWWCWSGERGAGGRGRAGGVVVEAVVLVWWWQLGVIKVLLCSVGRQGAAYLPWRRCAQGEHDDEHSVVRLPACMNACMPASCLSFVLLFRHSVNSYD